MFRFLAAFVVGFALMGSIGAGALYLWSREYDGRVLPGVSVGSSDIGGLTREQAASKVASDYASLGSGEITFNGPDGDMTTISYAQLGRRPDTDSLVEAAIAAGRRSDLLANLIGGPQTAINGVTLTPSVTYDRDKLAAAVDSLATSIDQTPTDACRPRWNLSDYTMTGDRYDWIVDTDSHQSILKARRALKDGGVYVNLGGTTWPPWRISIPRPTSPLRVSWRYRPSPRWCGWIASASPTGSFTIRIWCEADPSIAGLDRRPRRPAYGGAALNPSTKIGPRGVAGGPGGHR